MRLGLGIGANRSKNLSSAITPDQISGLEAWFDSESGVTVDSGLVSSWVDKVNGHTLSQTGSDRPAFGTNTLSGYNSITFSEPNDHLQSSLDIQGVNAVDGTWTVFTVITTGASFSDIQYVIDHDNIMLGERVAQFIRISTDPFLQSLAFTSSVTPVAQDGNSTALSANTSYLLSSRFTGEDGEVEAFVNNSSGGGTSFGSNTPATTATRLTIAGIMVAHLILLTSLVMSTRY